MFDRPTLANIKRYLRDYKREYPLVYANKKLRIYETFIGVNNDGCDIPSDDPRPIALLADKLFYKETLSKQEFLDVIKYSKELDLLEKNLVEFSLNEYPLN